MAVEHGWAIVGDCGLYVGWMTTRAAAIARHVYDLRGIDEPSLTQFAFGQLSPDQRRAWDRCKKQGDRAVKVRISY